MNALDQIQRDIYDQHERDFFAALDPLPLPVEPVSPTISLEEAVAVLVNAAADPARVRHIANLMHKSGLWASMGLPERVQKVAGPPPAFPALSAWTAAQIAIFDNWPGGRRVDKQPCRYGAAIEVWTKPGDEISIDKKKKPNWDFKSSGTIMDHKNLTNLIKRCRRDQRKTVSSSWLDTLDDLAAGIENSNYHVLLLNTNIDRDDRPHDRGVWYHEGQYVLFEIDRDEFKSARVGLPGGDLDIGGFDDKDAGGSLHRGNVVLQARLDFCGFSKSWKTNS